VTRPDLWRRTLPYVVLCLLAALAHAPALLGPMRFAPIYSISGVVDGDWTRAKPMRGNPGWIDGNAGVTTEAMGALAARDWLHGVVPWWNPYAGVGLPLAAEQSASPFFLPFVLLLALHGGLLKLRVVLTALAGLCSFALLRRMGLRTLPSLAGAALFELNGTFAWAAHAPIMPVAFLPMILLGLEQARGGRFPLMAGLGTAWTLLAGFPEVAFFDLLFAAAWGALRLAQDARKPGYALRCCGAVLLGAMVSAPAVLPFFQDLPRSFLSVHAGPTYAHLSGVHLGLMLFPYLYGNVFAGLPELGDRAIALWWEVGGYCDLVPVGLASLALRWRGREAGLRWFLLLWLVVTVCRAAALPQLARAMDAVPLMRRALFSLYVVPSWSMALSVLAALALDDAAAGVRVARRPRVVVLAAATGAALALAWPHIALLRQHLPGYVVFPVASVAGGWAVYALCLALLRETSSWARAALTALVAANATVLFALPLFAGPVGRHVDIDAVRWLRAHAGLQRVQSFGPLAPNYGSMFGIAEIAHNYLPVPQVWVDYVRAHFVPEMDGINFYHNVIPPDARLGRLLDSYEQAGVAYALSWTRQGAAFDRAGAALVYRDPVMDVWALPHPAPYFTAAGCTLTPRGRNEVAARCAAPSLLVRRELAWPGWRAWRDGRRTPIRTVQEVFQGVALPAGDTMTRFRFAPPHIGWAWLAALIGAAGLLLASLPPSTIAAAKKTAAGPKVRRR
jgi:hypothetical protein